MVFSNEEARAAAEHEAARQRGRIAPPLSSHEDETGNAVSRLWQPPADGYVYLASPYTHDDPEVVEDRVERVCIAAGRLMGEHGIHVFSPIAHSHAIARLTDLPTDFEFWRSWNIRMLEAAAGFLVLELDGWQDSAGVIRESAWWIRYRPVHRAAFVHFVGDGFDFSPDWPRGLATT